MKFGKYLDQRQNPQWKAHYIDYKVLKDLIKAAAEQAAANGHNVAFSPRTTSLTVQRGRPLNKTNAELDFFSQLDAEVSRCALMDGARACSRACSRVSGSRLPRKICCHAARSSQGQTEAETLAGLCRCC